LYLWLKVKKFTECLLFIKKQEKVPKGVEPPKNLKFKPSKHHNDIINLINKYFNKHPGNLENIWFPVNRKGAEKQLEDFLKNKFTNFGIYEDAMLEGKNFLFHSCISALLNIGLLDPETVIKKTMKFASDNNIPINSLEGFIRQIIGWREFIRGIYHEEGKFQIKQNYWNHEKKLTKSWYEGTTGIDPLDDCIKTTLNDGYIHHIPRLMVISNIMNLAGIAPKEIYKWFMEMYIDSSDWVMVPNVFGMATYADGGLMSTKPYTCGSNYILKMSNYKKGDWCDVLDGLYWKFTEENRTFYENNPRLALLTRSLDKMNPERKQHIFNQAEMFIKQNTN
jgi:deoxyribodipyrimidine photolyase-related protein